ncbi:profilin-3-like isoform X2 [Cottoperca gobio]|nr:profilin-3-like isoform X2 [Cottoperca gobio]
MSWDLYITKLMAADTNGIYPVKEAAICGYDGSIWASTEKLKCITPEEIKKLIGDTCCFHQCGPHVAGMKCMMIKDEYDVPEVGCLQLKSKSETGESYNICVGKALQCVIIAQGTKEASGGQLTNMVHPIVKYLIGLKY